jgi:hypothetical protein
MSSSLDTLSKNLDNSKKLITKKYFRELYYNKLDKKELTTKLME